MNILDVAYRDWEKRNEARRIAIRESKVNTCMFSDEPDTTPDGMLASAMRRCVNHFRAIEKLRSQTQST